MHGAIIGKVDGIGIEREKNSVRPQRHTVAIGGFNLQRGAKLVVEAINSGFDELQIVGTLCIYGLHGTITTKQGGYYDN